MKTMMTLSMLAAAVAAGCCHAATVDEQIGTALKEGEAKVLLRYRYEYVDQDGITETAGAT